MKIVSACLAGYPCRYNGEAFHCRPVIDLVNQGQAIPLCPEQLGGLSTPREPAEQVGDRVINKLGEDVTEAYKKGARVVLEVALAVKCEEAILKSKSPACGCGQVYDGSFSGMLIEGDGVLTETLKNRGIKVITEEEFENLNQE